MSSQSLPFIFFRNFVCFNSSQPSTFSNANMKLKIPSLSLIIRYSLNQKNNPMEYFPYGVNTSKVLWINMRWFRCKLPAKPPWRKRSAVTGFPSPVPQNGYRTHTWERDASMLTNILFVVILETSEDSRMEQDQNDHDFRITHPVKLVLMSIILVFDHVFFLHFGKFLAKIIRHTINLRNFNHWEHSSNCWNFVIDTTNLMILPLYYSFSNR